MLDPSKRFVTLVLVLGIIVLVAAILVGERMGDRVIGQVTEKRLSSIAPVAVTPAPDQTSGPYGPDWKRQQVLSAAGDPAFPDPRVPPVPLPTVPPRPKSTPTPTPAAASPTPTPNVNLPIWRRLVPLPTASPVETPTAGSESASPQTSESPEPKPSGSQQ